MVRLTQSERYAVFALLAILTGCTLPPGGHEHRPELVAGPRLASQLRL